MPARKCGTCRHYQQSPLRRLGWCRNPRLHDEKDRSLVGVQELPCDKSFYDFWEPRTKESRAERAAHAEGRPAGRTNEGGNKPRVVVLYSLVAAVVVILIVAGAAMSFNRSSKPLVVVATPTLPAPTPTATVTPTPTPIPAIFVRIANTDGDGAFIRPQPSKLSKGIVAYPDGTRLEVVGEDVQAEGRAWRKVKDGKGNVGYVPAQYLVPEKN